MSIFGIIFELDLKSKSHHNICKFVLEKYGGVTVSTGITEAVVAYRGSYRPR